MDREIKSLTDNQQKVLRILLADTNADATITGLNLAKRVGFLRKQGEDQGGMRGVIHALRVKGFPICANGRGYFYARSDEELSKFIFKLQGRVDKQQEAVFGLKEAYHNIGKLAENPKVEYTKRVPVRTPNGSMTYFDLKLGDNGIPIMESLPTGYTLL